jgi:Pectate lyase superfamily protein
MIVDRRWMMASTLLAVASTACGQTASAENAGSAQAFGAKGDGVTDDGPAIQRAIDAAAAAGGGTVTLDPGTYLLRYRPSEDGDGGSALTLRSGVTLAGTDRSRCILKLADAQLGPGSYARIIASKGDIQNAALRSLSIDGSRQAQGEFRDTFGGAAVLLGWKGRCVDITVENLHIHDAVGQGIMLQGTIGNVSHNLRIANNLVERTSFIGIQCSQFDGIQIVGNQVYDCYDNAIDVYGDDTSGHSTVVTSHHATITDNQIRGCSIGVFLETVADCIAARNAIEDCRTAGVRVNRIHGEPRNLTIERNRITGTPVGIAIGGDTGGVVIRDNDIRGFKKAGIEFSYNVSRVTATGNRFIPAAPATPIVLAQPTKIGSTPEEQLAHINISSNLVPRGHDQAMRFANTYRRMVDVHVGDFSIE